MPGTDETRPAAAGPGVRTYALGTFTLAAVTSAKGARSVSVCIPAHQEEGTVAAVVAAAGGPGSVADEVLVVDDGSSDATAAVAERAGARVVRLRERRGKGAAMQAAVEASEGDLIVFLDADVENSTPAFVTSLLGPIVTDDAALVKGLYERPFAGSPTGGGRVNELLARPVLEVLFPELAGVRQPLAGETALPRSVAEKLTLEPGYGVEMGMLLDVAAAFGPTGIAQVDLGVRIHRNRSLDELRPQAVEVLRAALDRADRRRTRPR